MEFEKEILKGYIDTIILSIISKKPIYAYKLSKEILMNTKGTFSIKESTLYLALKRLEKSGFIMSWWDESKGSPRRKYYDITNIGIERLENKQREWREFKQIVDFFLN
ncbi:PadR family transcriptional regulator [Schinkia azotoformans]|uniref:Transcriptional regulator, PadR-like family protein n=1 Tax=Schinkia azotoformans LMG 9581 TaxID=1131731 RepID=K6DIN3_SCHAZ|nr:PadR family transcriptional regulator [Schinkia azotoformans]EKN68169.1 transcriptional regulator, PadR-like family protein [Schinkia azotoformans LMG 9581]MEC1639668.1 PadR family transcriptional regulator [Schinkia azotoformans]MEC1722473.1 PadR family transcriptional regulator [Schinkia azotoformans]MEC1946968.1 PadR family transcriptional regulator [Schinkia azotoformans]MED4350854.1 PadR family transcriptional regulator [Schinkia azotoformans]